MTLLATIVVQSNAMISFDLRYVYGRSGFDPTAWEFGMLDQASFKYPSFSARLGFELGPARFKPNSLDHLKYLSSAGSLRMKQFSPPVAEISKIKQQPGVQIPPIGAPSSAFSLLFFVYLVALENAALVQQLSSFVMLSRPHHSFARLSSK